MNFRLISRILGIVSYFVAAGMLLALPWGMERFGGDWVYERRGVVGLVLAMLTSVLVGALFSFWGRKADKLLLRKETLAIVPLSWFVAVILAALPYLFSETYRAPGIPMGITDAIFEATSGLTTTGATVIAELEDPSLVPRCILFWRSVTHFMGGLGIMVFFVAILGYGTVGKRIMSVEKGESASTGSWGHYREFAVTLAWIYGGLIVLLAILLKCYGLTLFDAVCHAFSTLSTGGFSTFNASVGHFAAETGLNSAAIEMTIAFFMLLGGTNFVLLCLLFKGKPGELFRDLEWRTYICVFLAATAIVFVSGLVFHNFDVYGSSDQPMGVFSGTTLPWYRALRQSFFQVASLLTGTGFVTDEFEKWNSLALFVFILICFMGGCVGGTSGGAKVARFIIAFKTFGLELDKVFRPNAVKSVKIGRTQVSEATLYSAVCYLLFLITSVAVVTFLVLIVEPDAAWTQAGSGEPDRLLDLFSSTLSMFTNVGPGFGLFGARENFGMLTGLTKLIYSFSMFAGRLELYLPLLICSPNFWRK